jgi:hypothetical protein
VVRLVPEQLDGDAVGVEVRSNTTSAADYWLPEGANRLSELSRSENATVASFVWGSTAKAVYPGGSSEDGGVGSYQNLSANGSHYLVRLEFVSVTGGYSALSYDPWLSLTPLSAAVGKAAAWILTPTSIAVIAGAASGTLVLALAASRRRSPPESEL